MDKRQHMLDMALRLRQQAQARQWHALLATDRDLAQMLARPGMLGPFNAREQKAWNSLKLAHAQAHQACAQAFEQARVRLQTLCERRDGWNAYAMNDERELA